MTFDRVLTVLRAHLLHIVACVLLGVLIGLITFFLLPRTYESQALVWVASQDETAVPGALPEDRMATYLEYARSERVSSAAAETLVGSGHPGDPGEDVEIAVPEESSILTVTGTGASPQAAQEITDAVAEAAAERLAADDPSGLGMTVEVAQEATLPEHPVAPSLLLAVLAGALAGGLAGVLLALVLGSRRPRLYTADAAAGRLGTRVLGSLGEPPHGRARRERARSGLSGDPGSIFADLGLAQLGERSEVLAVAGVDDRADVPRVVGALAHAAGGFGIGARVLTVADLAAGAPGTAPTESSVRAGLDAARRDSELVILTVDDVLRSPVAPVLLAGADSAVYVYGAEPLVTTIDSARTRMRSSRASVRGAVQAPVPAHAAPTRTVEGNHP